jgi:hypothetical protein
MPAAIVKIIKKGLLLILILLLERSSNDGFLKFCERDYILMYHLFGILRKLCDIGDILQILMEWYRPEQETPLAIII